MAGIRPARLRYGAAMEPEHVVPIQFALNLTTYAIIVRAFVYPALRKLPLYQALQPLVLVHCIRTLGMFALVPSIAGPEVANSKWAEEVAIGDGTTVVLALVTVLALRARPSWGIWLTWLLNLVGLVDIVNAGVNAAKEHILEHAGLQLAVITFGVPALIVSHITLLVLLVRGSAEDEQEYEGEPEEFESETERDSDAREAEPPT